MPLSLIQVTTLLVFMGSLSISFLYDVLKYKKIRLGIIETIIVPIIIVIIILSFNFNFKFTNNGLISVLGLLMLMSGLIFGLFSASALGENKDDFWIARKNEKERTFVTTGPYSKIRHPIYTSMIFYYLGLILVFFNWVTVLVYIVFLVVIMYTAISEEKFMGGKFRKYGCYMKKTGMFFPKFSVK